MKNKLNIRRIALDAVLAAMFVVLSLFTIKVGGNYQFSLDAFPIIVGAALFGPLDGALIGLVGSTIEQVFFSGYGITVTTPLWILPAVARGLIIGLYARHYHYELNEWRLVLITIVSAIVVTLLNTLALYVDSKIFGYYSYSFVFGLLIPKFIIGIILSVVYSLIIPSLLRHIKKNVKLPERGNA
ncbi:MAG: ECF transporter S component [Oscillospiraceae bacterium]